MWLINLYKPVWVGGQLKKWDKEVGWPPATTSYLIKPTGSSIPRVVECHGGITGGALSELCDKEQLGEAVEALGVLLQTQSRVSISVFHSLLKRCAVQKNRVLGRRVHDLIVQAGYEANTFLANHILRMYASHGSLEEAKDVFSRVKPDAFTWSAMMSALAKHGQPKQAIELYHEMRGSGVNPDGHVFVAALQACASAADFKSGRQVHDDVLESGVQPALFICTCLVNMYAKCGRLEDARSVFDNMPTRDVVTWNAMIAGYANFGRLDDARRLFDSLPMKDVVTWNAMVSGYAKCGRLEDARRVFDSMPSRDVVTWTSMITGYVENEHGQKALSLYKEMEQEGIILADSVAFGCLLKACAKLGALEQGKQLHSQILERGLSADVWVGNCLVDMYAKCGRFEEARRVFDSLSTRDVVTWNAMIAGYAKFGNLEVARSLFDKMPARDVVTWTAMIAGYVEHEHGEEALSLYEKMEQEGMVVANRVTFACLLKACARVASLKQGKRLHLQILERGLEVDMLLGNCLVDMYAKCGRLEVARLVFDSLPTRDVVTWNSMIGGYVELDHGQEALSLYEQMEKQGMILAGSVAFACLLRACGKVGALQQGKQLHSKILERGLEADVKVGSSLVDMYARCGRLDDAQRIFNSLPLRDVVTWTVMIDAYGQSNDGHKAIACYKEMLHDGVEPDGATFICLLVACSHEGLVHEGWQYFNTMVEDFGIVPTAQHFSCMVDLLGRSGYLDEAERLLSSFENNDVALMSLLNACRSHSDIERGTRCFECLVRLDPQNASAYVLLAKIYGDAGMWNDVDRIESLRKCAGASKKPAIAGIEVNKYVHTFVVGEEKNDVSCKTRTMNVQLKEGGHEPQTALVLKPWSHVAKEDELCGHAEKLALAYGLLNTPAGTPLLVTKNLRMCGDCHSATQVMSRIETREITVRDSHRVHRFVGGSCSCGGRP